MPFLMPCPFIGRKVLFPEPDFLPENYFSTVNYTGTGSTFKITTGLQMTSNSLFMPWQNNSGVSWYFRPDFTGGLQLSSTAGLNTVLSWVSSFDSDGVSVSPSLVGSGVVGNAHSFKAHSRFVEFGQFVGNGSTQRVGLSLDRPLGALFVKSASASGNWVMWSAAMAASSYMIYSSSNTQTSASSQQIFGDNSSFIIPDATGFNVGLNSAVNNSGVNYEYLAFAHDEDADGIIRCGSYIGTGSSPGPAVTLDWKPQMIFIFRITGSTSSNQRYIGNRILNAGDTWDTHWLVGAGLLTSTARRVIALSNGFRADATGAQVNSNGDTHGYIAIRAPA